MKCFDCCRRNKEEDKKEDEEKPKIKLTPKMKRDQRKKLAEQEENFIWWTRRAVVLVLLLAGAGMTYCVYRLATKNEQDIFRQQFDVNADLVMDTVVQRLAAKINALDALALQATQTALETEQAWPRVRLPDFFESAVDTRLQADAALIFLLPYVTNDDRALYEEYVNATFFSIFQDYLVEDDLRAVQDARYGIEARQRRAQIITYNDRIFAPNENPLPQESGPHFPIWQSSPVIPDPAILNLDLLRTSVYEGAIRRTLESNQTTLGFATNLVDGDPNNLFELALQLGQHRHDPLPYFSDPISRMVYPIFSSTEEPRSLVGVLAATVYFRALLDDILPDSAKAYIAVITNTLGQGITYLIDGAQSTYLGRGDLHAVFGDFDDLAQSAEINRLVRESAAPSNRGYNAADFDDDFNLWKITLYPSADSEAEYLTSGPMIYAICTGALFLFTAFVFYMYDRKVNWRQQEKMEEAVARGIIRVEYFPEDVGEEMERKHKEEKEEKERAKAEAAAIAAGEDPSGGGDDPAILVDANKPIADLYEQTTVLCADITGFSSWSASQIPSDVFLVLEKLHEAFDSLAEAREVYSIETTGDACMAVTGLPESMVDHAKRMVLFARDMNLQFKEILQELAETEGLDAQLDLRAGIHSGPTTAGILRGATRARYQITGETVTVARRVMLLGRAGRIHASQAAADALAETECKHWARKRKEKSGEVMKTVGQTYWIDTSLEKPEETEHDVEDVPAEVLPAAASTASTRTSARKYVKESTRESARESALGSSMVFTEPQAPDAGSESSDGDWDAALNDVETKLKARMSFM